MMATIAEGYETGLFKKENNIYEWDLHNYALSSTKLWWKHNYDIQDLILERLKNNWSFSLDDILNFKDSRVVPVLIKIIRASASEIDKFKPENSYRYEEILKYHAIEALGFLKDRRAVEPIIEILKDTNQDEYVRRNAIEALGRLKSDLAVQPLIEILQNNEVDLIGDAARALDLLGKAAVQPLIEIIDREDPDVRMFVASALGRIGDKKAIEPLYSIFPNQNSTTHDLLYTLGGGGFPPIAFALAELKATDKLIASLNNPNSIIRQQGVWALGKITDTRVVSPLIEALEDTNQEVREEARKSLQQLASESLEIKAMRPF